jgi:hypothetical protein
MGNRDKSRVESVRLVGDRRRRNRPETLRHKYFGLSRSLESGRADDGDDPPKGRAVA